MGYVVLATEFYNLNQAMVVGFLDLKKSHLSFKESKTGCFQNAASFEERLEPDKAVPGCLGEAPLTCSAGRRPGSQENGGAAVEVLRGCAEAAAGKRARDGAQLCVTRARFDRTVELPREPEKQGQLPCSTFLNSIQKYLYGSSKKKGLGRTQTLSCTQEKNQTHCSPLLIMINFFLKPSCAGVASSD